MARRALSATRAVDVVNFLASRPGEAFLLSELAAETGINLSSAHALMSALVESDWLMRDPIRKTYQLGPALVAVGQAAVERLPAVRRATALARELAAESGMETIVNTVAGEDLLTLEAAGRPEQLETRPRVGQRLPCMAPLGLGALAWDPPEVLDAWVRRSHPRATAKTLRSYRDWAAQVRSAGYEVGLESPIRDKIGQVLFELSLSPADEDLREAMGGLVARLAEEECWVSHDVDPASDYQVNYLGAPVFGPDARPSLAVTVLGLANPTSGARLLELADRVVSATRRVSVTTGGRLPLSL